jgi:HlyD family secretion protein
MPKMAIAMNRTHLHADHSMLSVTVRIAVPDAEVARLHGLKIIPGMPVEAFIQTESRTMLSYLLKPLMDQVTRTFRES